MQSTIHQPPIHRHHLLVPPHRVEGPCDVECARFLNAEDLKIERLTPSCACGGARACGVVVGARVWVEARGPALGLSRRGAPRACAPSTLRRLPPSPCPVRPCAALATGAATAAAAGVRADLRRWVIAPIFATVAATRTGPEASAGVCAGTGAGAGVGAIMVAGAGACASLGAGTLKTGRGVVVAYEPSRWLSSFCACDSLVSRS